MAAPPPNERLAREVPGYGEKLAKLLDKYDLTLTDLGSISCLSSSTIARAVQQDLVSARSERRIKAALGRLRQARQARRRDPQAGASRTTER